MAASTTKKSSDPSGSPGSQDRLLYVLVDVGGAAACEEARRVEVPDPKRHAVGLELLRKSKDLRWRNCPVSAENLS